MTCPTNKAESICPHCDTAFIQKRANQHYCSPKCQKTASRNTARGSRAISASPEAKRRSEMRAGRVFNLNQAFVRTMPQYRPYYLEMLIAEARGSADLRFTLSEAYRNIARGLYGHVTHCLGHYSREVYGLSFYAVISPKTVLPTPDELIYPDEYYSLYQRPLYGDGTLKVRPCPWATRQKSTLRLIIKDTKPIDVQGSNEHQDLLAA